MSKTRRDITAEFKGRAVALRESSAWPQIQVAAKP